MYVLIVFITLLSIVLSIVFQGNSKFCISISFIYILILSLIFGFRYDVGIDYNSYELYFNDYHDSFRTELGYSLINYIVYSLGLPFYVVTLFMSFSTNYLVFYGVWLAGLRGVYFQLAIILYVSNFMLLSLNGMRQALATAVIFCFITFLYKSNFFLFLKGCIIASLFHASAIAFILLFFLKSHLVKRNIVIFLCLLMVFTFLSVLIFDFSNIFMKLAFYIPYYEQYSDFSVSPGELGFGVTLRFVFSLILVFIFLMYSKRYNDFEHMLVSFFIIGLIFNFLSISSYMWGRIGMYFYIYEILVIPYIISKIKTKSYRTIMFVGATAYALIFIVSLLFFNEANHLSYQSVFD